MSIWVKKNEFNENPEKVIADAIQTAETDIYCYKMLDITETPTEFAAPYTGFRVELGKDYKDKSEEWIVESDWSASDEDYAELEITSGFFHTFVYADDAAYEITDYGWGDIVVECIIPKGTKYLQGENSERENYCSKELRYTKTIKFARIRPNMPFDTKEQAIEYFHKLGYEVSEDFFIADEDMYETYKINK